MSESPEQRSTSEAEALRDLDLEFYDHFFKPGAYLRTHAEHMQRWHGRPERR